MRGLVARLTASYILLAGVVLGGAGVFTYSSMLTYLRHSEAGWALEQGRTAVQLALQICRTDPSKSPNEVAAIVEESAAVRVRSLAHDRGPVLRLEGFPAQVEGIVIPQYRERCGVEITPLSSTEHLRIGVLTRLLLGSGALGLAVALLLAFWFSRALTAPLNRVTKALQQSAEGDWNAELPGKGFPEIVALSDAFRHTAARIEANQQRLQADRQYLQHLTAEISHEVKTPVAALRTYHELLLDGEGENPKSRSELLTRGVEQIDRLTYLIGFLEEMARLEVRAIGLEREEVDVAQVAQRTAQAWQPKAHAQGVTLDLEVRDAPLQVLTHPQRVGQALDNLLQNALKWSPVRGKVNVLIRREGKAAQIVVSDEGPGIEPELLPHIFEPFYRSDKSSGLGIGLALVRGIATNYGGSVMVQNRESGGAEFTLSFPLSTETGGQELV